MCPPPAQEPPRAVAPPAHSASEDAEAAAGSQKAPPWRGRPSRGSSGCLPPAHAMPTRAAQANWDPPTRTSALTLTLTLVLTVTLSPPLSLPPPSRVFWVPLLLLVIGSSPARGRDFTAHDIQRLYPSTTPYPGAFKCFTCEDAKDNYECNRWAPDTYCPRESRYCYTYHHMRSGGSSVSVTKRCAALEQCLGTGCRDGPLAGEQECVTCCEGSICNLPVPLNASDSVFATVLPLSAARSGTRGALPPGRLALLGLLAGVTALGV
ncbi:ly6/PLAUR domain-containing protein 6-like isoform X2 [Lampetra planeri]